MLKYLSLCFLFLGCARNVPFVKEQAPTYYQNNGFKIVAYEGYRWSPIDGGDVYYLVERTNDSKILYSSMLSKWGNEVQQYNLTVRSGQMVELK